MKNPTHSRTYPSPSIYAYEHREHSFAREQTSPPESQVQEPSRIVIHAFCPCRSDSQSGQQQHAIVSTPPLPFAQAGGCCQTPPTHFRTAVPGSAEISQLSGSRFRQPTFQSTCAMSRAVLTPSLMRPKRPAAITSSSSSSYGMNMPLSVRRMPSIPYASG